MGWYGWRSEVATAGGQAVFRWKLLGSETTVEVNAVTESSEHPSAQIRQFRDCVMVGEVGEFVKLVSVRRYNEAALDALEPLDAPVQDGVRDFYGSGLVL